MDDRHRSPHLPQHLQLRFRQRRRQRDDSTLLAAVNQHQRLAAWYLFGTSVTVVLTYLLSRSFGLYWAAASLLVSEIVMDLYVLPASLRLSEDTPGAFLASMLHYPQSLRPAALLARLRRAPAPSFEPPEEAA